MNILKNQPVTRWPTYFFSGYWDTYEKFQKSVKSYIKLPFLANLIAFLDSLGQKTYMGEFSGLYHVPVRKYSRKRCQENGRPGDTSGNLFPNKKCSKSESAWS